MKDNDQRPGCSAGFGWYELLAGVVLLLFVGLRAGFVGHLLTWDEAATLLSVRSFASRGVDYYAGWFWRRPPFYNLLLTLARPLLPGLHIRAQMLSLGVAALSGIVLWGVNRQVFGKRIAIWALFFWAVMPGAIFYDTWIKQDGLVSLFGLLAVWLFVRGRPLQSGLCLGAGFLTKELTLFYAVALSVVWWVARRQRSWKELAVAYLTAGAMASWWYLLFSNSIKAVWKFLSDASNLETQAWTRPWYYFFEQLRLDLDGWGILLALYGCFALWDLMRKRARDEVVAQASVTSVAIVWPLALLVPAYTLITFMKAKTPWYTISIFPAWATLQAVGFDALLTPLVMARRGGCRRVAGLMVVGCVVAGTLGLRWHRDFEAELRAREWGLWWGSYTSRETARRLNELVKADERVLITPMFYWTISKQIPCVVFVYYLRPQIPVVVRGNDMTVDEFVDVVRKYQLHWAMVSPDPREGEKRLIHPLVTQYGLDPYWNRGACIFRTDSLWREAAESGAESLSQASLEAHTR